MRSCSTLVTLGLLAGLVSPAVGWTDITCEPLEDNTIDWDCIFGVDSLQEVYKHGGGFTSCKVGKDRPCSRFIVPKSVERAETKVTFGPELFPFLENERYVFKYSFRAVDGMKLGKRFTHIGQIKAAYHGKKTVDGDPIVSISANKNGLHVRFANQDSIDDYYTDDDWYRNWEDATGAWVDVTITTVFGQSMEVEFAGGVTGKFVWPEHLKPVGWNPKSKMARMKLGLYHKEDEVADGEVEIRDVSIEGPNGIIRTSPERTRTPPPSPSPSPPPPTPTRPTPTPTPTPRGGTTVVCDSLKNNQIDWDCVFGPESLEEVEEKGGEMVTCPKAHEYACSRFKVKKEKERAEVKIQEGPEGFGFYKGETYTYRYSFRAKEGMKVSKRFTHLGQLKGSVGMGGGKMVKGDPIYSLTANKDGLMVRFSNLESIEDFHEGLEKHLDWGDATGQWVHVKIVTTFGESMEVTLSGAVEGKAVWPKQLRPVAWHRDADRVRMKLGLYHKKNEVADGEVEYKDISIVGPNGVVTTARQSSGPAGHVYRGCFGDSRDDRMFTKKYVDAHMTTPMCADLCEDSQYFGLQYGNECWCSLQGDTPHWHWPERKCDMDCAGGGRISKCGGYYGNDVYERGGQLDDIPKGGTYLGCFRDAIKDRVLTLKMTTSDKMDYDACDKLCDKEGAAFFGVEFGRECFCGRAKDKFDDHGAAICNMPCTGDSDLICGGRDAISVFAV